ncbi:MAG: hypothetical protein ACP5VS_18800 [Desulfomonilaceae bacterium]
MDNNFNEGFVLGEIAKENIPMPFFGEEILEAHSLRFNQIPDKDFIVYRFQLNPRHDPIANTLTEKMFLWQVMDTVHGVPLLVPSLMGLTPYMKLLTKEDAIKTAITMLMEFEVTRSKDVEAIFRAFFMVRGNYEQYLKNTARKMEPV